MQVSIYYYYNHYHHSSSVEAYRPTQHIVGHFRDDFYRSYDQTNSVKALKETTWSFR